MLLRKTNKGQGLVEYALVLALVALVAIVIMGVLGMAVSRGYALVAGALGAQKSDSSPTGCGSPECIEITQSSCYIVAGSNNTQIIVNINFSQNINVSDLSVSTPTGFLNTPWDISSSGAVNSASQTTIIPGTNPAACPTTVVVQSKHTTVIGTVTVAYF